jgi:choline dehydrogenase-like flavoprotein
MRDIVIVGSGPSGAQAAKEAVESGLSVTMLDVGFDEPTLAASIPAAPFSQLRRTDRMQRRYFLGEEGETDADVNDRIGAHFTPPRSYIKRGVAQYAPVASQTFFPELSLALGGLAAGWGSGSQVFEPFELERAGLPVGEMRELYESVARDIGISGSLDDDTASASMPERNLQPAAQIDSNARSIFAAYGRKKDALNASGFVLGRACLAMLTQPLEVGTPLERGPNPYFDMDFYSDANRSVYRAKYTIEELEQHPNFRYVDRALVTRYETSGDGVAVYYRDLRDGVERRLDARRLLLAANALNTARIVLRSNAAYDLKQPLLCNPYHYIPAVNLSMIGRAADDRRHSLAQLVGSFTPEHRGGEHVFAAFFSYRSLLHFRLVREMPLPPALGLLVSRVLMNAFTIVGVHHPERASEAKWVRLAGDARQPIFEAHYELGADERDAIAADVTGIKRCLRALGCMPMQAIATPAGSSIHYAGTIPFESAANDPALTCEPSGRLRGAPQVFVADSSTWRYLPAKGPTLTMMANGRRVARQAARDLAG